jgi:D-glycero-D-manno-heptose 1,7-bisphosphate phosphatase
MPPSPEPASGLHRAVFLDRDGVINPSVVRDGKPYPPQTVEDFQIYPEVPEACRRLKAAGYLLVVATNQPDVGRGTQSQEAVEAMHAKMRAALPIDRVEVCYHSGHAPCECRKPRAGMLLAAANLLSINLSRSFMVGDRWRDIDCGHAAGCTTIFIDRGYTEELRQKPDFFAENLEIAANLILQQPFST